VASSTLLLCLFTTSPARAIDYSLTLVSQGSGTVTADNTNSPYPEGVNIKITATPNTGWYFANWSGNATGTVNPLEVPINSNLVITGNFVAYPTYSLALTTNGMGAIALNPTGGSYYSNTVVTATATPAAGWVFANWSGAASSTSNPVSFSLDANGNLTGNFAELPAFAVQPVSVTNLPGSTVSFSVQAGGTALSYQWFFNGAALSNDLSAILTLTNISTMQAGSYWVVATNNYGSATSSVASLTLASTGGTTNILTTTSEKSLVTALAAGGWVGLQINGTLSITNTINITNTVVLDGSGFSAILSGGDTVQLFTVAKGASLTLSNLTLANGYCLLTNGLQGVLAGGGAIANNGGTVGLVGCTLTNNAAESMVYGGLACGGAIYNSGGTVFLGQSLVVSNFVIGGGPSGFESANYGEGFGGALYNTNGTVFVSGCKLLGNVSANICGENSGGQTMGGAVFQSAGSMTISNSSLLGNQADGGAGVWATTELQGPAGTAAGGALGITGGTLVVGNCQLAGNEAVGGTLSAQSLNGGPGTASGGAIYCTGMVTVADTTFSGNNALAGGYLVGSLGISGCGGGIYNSGTFTLNRCALYSNTAVGGVAGQYGNIVGGAALGAGIYNAGQLAATNCTIALNSTTGGAAYDSAYGISATTGSGIGGGVYNAAGATLLAMNLTMANNTCSSPPGSVAAAGFAAGFQIANVGGTFSLHNCIIADTSSISNAYGTFTDAGYNVCSDTSANLDGGSSYNDTNPQLEPLGNYGGPTWCMALAANSPAIGTADPHNFPTTDQRGYLRPASNGPDMGAYEAGASAFNLLQLAPSAGNPTNLLLSFAANPAVAYRIQCSTNLITWTDVSTNGPFASATACNQTFTAKGAAHCYFRLRLQ
jgi:hypothetical protein